MVGFQNRRMRTTGSVCVFLSFLLFSIFSCSSVKSRDDEGVLSEGTTVSLDELEPVEGINPPRPEEETLPVKATAKSPTQLTAGRGNTSLPYTPARFLKKRIVILPFGNNTEYKSQPYGEIATRKLIQALEGSGQVVVLDDRLLEEFLSKRGIDRNDLRNPFWTKELSRAFGIHAVIFGAVAQLNVATTKSTVSQDIEVGLATAKIEAHLVDGSTGNTIRTYTARNPVYKSKEIGEFNQERAILRAIDIDIGEIAEGLLDSLTFIEWSARVVQTNSQRVYINAGRQSGLRMGDILDVYGPGEEIINPLTQQSLGWAPGALKGRIRVAGFLGVDGAYATPLEGDDFKAEDLVKLGGAQPTGQ